MLKREATEHRHDRKHPRSLVALFGSPEEARQAIAALRKSHFTHTWLGLTSLAETSGGDATLTVESAKSGFFSKTESLIDALGKHGVPGDTARTVERDIEAGTAILTIDPKKRDIMEAVAIVREFGGSLPDDMALGDEEAFREASPERHFVNEPTFWSEATFYRSSEQRL